MIYDHYRCSRSFLRQFRTGFVKQGRWFLTDLIHCFHHIFQFPLGKSTDHQIHFSTAFLFIYTQRDSRCYFIYFIRLTGEFSVHLRQGSQVCCHVFIVCVPVFKDIIGDDHGMLHLTAHRQDFLDGFFSGLLFVQMILKHFIGRQIGNTFDQYRCAFRAVDRIKGSGQICRAFDGPEAFGSVLHAGIRSADILDQCLQFAVSVLRAGRTVFRMACQ